MNNQINPSNNYTSSNGEGLRLSLTIINNLIKQFGSILEPVSVTYSNQVLLDQIYALSFLLFFLSVCIIFLIIALILNVVVYVNSDKILNYFTNKYIILLVKFNLKIMSLEILFLGGSILYFMYILSKVLHFICTTCLRSRPLSR